MRFGMLQTGEGALPIAVDPQGNFADIRQIDPALPATIFEILRTPGTLGLAVEAARLAIAKRIFVAGRLLSPIGRPGKVLCIGLNYRDHARESGMPLPSMPVVFNKFPQCVIGPDAPVLLPRASKQVDYEAELVLVLGKAGKNISEKDALDYIAGYTIGNDVSARDWQIGAAGGQWLMGKAADTFAPLGPWMVTSDEVEDPQNLRIRMRLNGVTMQDSSTKELIFGVDKLIAHLSLLTTLEPGDIVYTGTPPGVGMARKPPLYLKAGDVMEVEIEGLGVLRNSVLDEEG